MTIILTGAEAFNIPLRLNVSYQSHIKIIAVSSKGICSVNYYEAVGLFLQNGIGNWIKESSYCMESVNVCYSSDNNTTAD